MEVTLEKDAHVVGTDTIHPSNPDLFASRRVGAYSFSGLTPGEYVLVFKYGESVVSREAVVLVEDRIEPRTSHLLLSQYPPIPICA